MIKSVQQSRIAQLAIFAEGSYGRVLSALSLLLALFFSGCAQRPVVPGEATRGKEPAFLFEQACLQGRSVSSAVGSIFMKAKSPEAEGQFPAEVKAQAPGTLRLEVQNPLGGTEAVISVDHQKYSVQLPKKKTAGEEGRGSWAGIPLRWATDLFLGRIPCPERDDIETQEVDAEGRLVISTRRTLKGAPEKFVFGFILQGGDPWPETLHWERQGPLGVSVDFRFLDPEARTHAPLRWEARSSRGEVKVRWRDRRVTTR